MKIINESLLILLNLHGTCFDYMEISIKRKDNIMSSLAFSIIFLTVVLFSIMVSPAYSMPYDGKVGMVTIGFDHGFTEQFNASQYMKQYKMTGTLWVTTNRTINSNSMSWANLSSMYNSGWEMASHTQKHLHLNLESNSILYSEIVGSKQDLIDHGMKVCGFVPPFGFTANQTVLSLIKSNYNYTFKEYNMTNSPITLNILKNKFGLPVILTESVGDASIVGGDKNKGQIQNFTIAKERIDYAISHKTWIVIHFHDFVNPKQVADRYQQPTSWTLFQNIIKYINQQQLAGKIKVDTISHGLGYEC